MPASAPSPFPWIDVIVILLLIALNGVFAMAELAIVSSRKPRLRALAKAGSRGAQTAIDLAAEPGRFLSAVQIGISLIGILAGAYSGASLGGPVAERLAGLGMDPETAKSVGFGIVIIIVTYGSLVIGELVPKQFALRSPESIAAVMAIPMLWIAKATAPLVWLLDRTSALIFRLLRLRREESNKVTAEELQLVVAEAHSAGVLEEYERAIISGVVRLADRPTREVMTPRTEIDWIDADATPEELRELLRTTEHSRLPVAEGDVDKLLGVVQARDIVSAFIEQRELDLRALVRPAPVVADQMDAMDTMAVLRDAEVPIAFVHDEYGHFEGIVTPADLLAALAGVFATDFEGGREAPLVEREDGSWWVSGSLPADLLSDRLGINLPDDRDYATTAGFALAVLKHIPEVGERFSYGGWRFEIVDMDGFKIDKLLASEIVRKRRGG
ncbi:HlyC/CorC family transporter [Sphingomonas parva]|uniref:HlyC/CorC family transporter n=1 Tax=Sphingomonas parva TaxID=2555898 RepID=A0A4Y8ZVA2_9SPHN|nr:hemolysin family protein [Sphingomonas parva]TFI59940.1 HlyC/CorC family transporter [Sphingomonas parva]